jgi:hypothetical protein
MGLRHERGVSEWCEEAIEALAAVSNRTNLLPLENGPRESNK